MSPPGVPLKGLLALAIGAAMTLACGASDDGTAAQTPADESATEQQTQPVSPPPTIDPTQYANAGSAVALPQLVGLTEQDARDWAKASGFVTVVRSDGDYPDMLAPAERIILDVDEDGMVLGAVAG